MKHHLSLSSLTALVCGLLVCCAGPVRSQEATYRTVNGTLRSASDDGQRAAFYSSSSRTSYVWDGQTTRAISTLGELRLLSGDGTTLVGGGFFGGAVNRGSWEGTLLDTFRHESGQLRPEAISTDGTIVIGRLDLPETVVGGVTVPARSTIFYWSAAGGLQDLDPPPNTVSDNIRVTPDGAAVFAFVSDTVSPPHLFRWRLGEGWSDLGAPPNDAFIVPGFLVSNDGQRVIVGRYLLDGQGWQRLADYDGEPVKFGCMTPDGQTFFGRTLAFDGSQRLVKWNAGVYTLLSAARGFEPTRCTPDGSLLAGRPDDIAEYDTGPVADEYDRNLRGFAYYNDRRDILIWHAAFGVRALSQVLAGDGAHPTAMGWRQYDLAALTATPSGFRLVGTGLRRGLLKGWMAELPLAESIAPDPFQGTALHSRGPLVPSLVLREISRGELPDGPNNNSSAYSSALTLTVPLAGFNVATVNTDTSLQLFLDGFGFGGRLADASSYSPAARRAVWDVPYGRVIATWTARQIVVRVAMTQVEETSQLPPTDLRTFSLHRATWGLWDQAPAIRDAAELSFAFGPISGRRMVRLTHVARETYSGFENADTHRRLITTAAFVSTAIVPRILAPAEGAIIRQPAFRISCLYTGIEEATLSWRINGGAFTRLSPGPYNPAPRERIVAQGELQRGANVIVVRLTDRYGNASTARRRVDFRLPPGG